MSTSEIYNYIKVNENLITGGQPTAEQLKSAAAEGFVIVINLATINPRYSLEDEAGLVDSLGMTYYHIPVDWENPEEGDFLAFERLLAHLPAGKTIIHCAANFRVTAFYSLYAEKHLGWSAEQAEEFRAQIWKGSSYTVWESFIRRMRSRLESET